MATASTSTNIWKAATRWAPIMPRTRSARRCLWPISSGSWAARATESGLDASGFENADAQGFRGPAQAFVKGRQVQAVRLTHREVNRIRHSQPQFKAADEAG